MAVAALLCRTGIRGRHDVRIAVVFQGNMGGGARGCVDVLQGGAQPVVT